MRLFSTSEDKQVYGYDDKFHFYASNALYWRCSQDLESLIKEMRKLSKGKDGYIFHFWIWYIPDVIETTYDIVSYQPQHDGKVFLGEYK